MAFLKSALKASRRMGLGKKSAASLYYDAKYLNASMRPGMSAVGEIGGRYAKNAGAYTIKNLGVANAFVQNAFGAAKRFDYMGAAGLGARITGTLGKAAWGGVGGPRAWNAGKRAWSTTGGKIGIGAGAAVAAGGVGYAMSRGRSRKDR